MVRLLEPAGPPLARNGADASAAGGHENGPSDPPRLRPKYTRCAARRPIPVEIGAAAERAARDKTELLTRRKHGPTNGAMAASKATLQGPHGGLDARERARVALQQVQHDHLVPPLLEPHAGDEERLLRAHLPVAAQIAAIDPDVA